jgi:limonene-1,2-epoxide hydrolase
MEKTNQRVWRMLCGGLLASLLCFSGVAAGQTAGVRTMTDNETSVRNFIAAWSRLDAAELAGWFTEDGTYFNIPGTPVTGRDNIERFIAGFIRPWQSTDWEIVNLFGDGDLVVAERVDHTVVNGAPIDLPVTGIFEMRGGKIREWRDYFDMPTYTEALTRALQSGKSD